MKMLNKIFALVLIAVVAIGSVGVSVSQHFCHDKQEAVSFFNLTNSCSDDEEHEQFETVDSCCSNEVKSCCEEEQVNDDCCSVDSKYFKVNFDYSQDSPDFDFTVLPVNTLYNIQVGAFLIAENACSEFLPRPPDDVSSVYLADTQCFLI